MSTVQNTQNEIMIDRDNGETEMVESDLESMTVGRNKNTDSIAVTTVDNTLRETIITNGQMTKFPTTNSNAKSSVIILTSLKTGDNTKQATECAENTDSNPVAGPRKQQINKHVIVANSIRLSPQANKTSDGFQKSFLPTKTMKLQVNWGLLPRRSGQKILKDPQRPVPVEQTLMNARSLTNGLTATAQAGPSADSIDKDIAKTKRPKWGRVTCRTLPPSVSTLRGYRMLLLKNRQMKLLANTFYTQCNREQEAKKRNEISQSLELNADSSAPKQDVDPLQGIRKTDKFQRLKSRFESIFLWPAFIASTSVPHMDDTAETASSTADVNAVNSKTPVFKSPKKTAKKGRPKLKKRKHDSESDQRENEDVQSKKRLGRPVGSKSNSQRPTSPVRTSGRTQTQEKKIYSDRINGRRTTADRKASKSSIFDPKKRNSVFKLMKEYVQCKKIHQSLHTTSSLTTDDIPEEQMEIETLSAGPDPGLMEEQDTPMAVSFQQPAQQLSQMADISETGSCGVDVDAVNSQNINEAKIECTTTVSAGSRPILPCQAFNMESLTAPAQSVEGLVPMILSFDKDIHGNIIQTLRLLNDPSQLPPNSFKGPIGNATVGSSDNLNKASFEGPIGNATVVSSDNLNKASFEGPVGNATVVSSDNLNKASFEGPIGNATVVSSDNLNKASFEGPIGNATVVSSDNLNKAANE
ncbi:uncharacterized protein LOC121383956 [Gigantopelta aegis]|uniref:uncharacterized protein LOC121383956 n=1 Tax=Gigantopelta aegis TaxID=1735272 RepID=UPI001B8895FA|nr:uncharacterized protein LOC121383956 [Gigantopelta aegis]